MADMTENLIPEGLIPKNFDRISAKTESELIMYCDPAIESLKKHWECEAAKCEAKWSKCHTPYDKARLEIEKEKIEKMISYLDNILSKRAAIKASQIIGEQRPSKQSVVDKLIRFTPVADDSPEADNALETPSTPETSDTSNPSDNNA